MDDNPTTAFIGWTLFGFALLLGYTTWKKVPGGAIGLLKSVLTTGVIPGHKFTTAGRGTGNTGAPITSDQLRASHGG